MKPRVIQAAPPTPEWTALVKHLQACEACRTSGPCDIGQRLVEAHKGTRG